jgi:hypothetical protein
MQGVAGTTSQAAWGWPATTQPARLCPYVFVQVDSREHDGSDLAYLFPSYSGKDEREGRAGSARAACCYQAALQHAFKTQYCIIAQCSLSCVSVPNAIHHPCCATCRQARTRGGTRLHRHRSHGAGTGGRSGCRRGR